MFYLKCLTDALLELPVIEEHWFSTNRNEKISIFSIKTFLTIINKHTKENIEKDWRKKQNNILKL